MTRNAENWQRRQAVFRLHDQGYSQREIARRLGIPRTSVQYIVSKREPDKPVLATPALSALLSRAGMLLDETGQENRPEVKDDDLTVPEARFAPQMRELADSIRADIDLYRAKIADDGLVLDGKPHPLISELRKAEASLARVMRAADLK
jgi:lambda repressor-like predicted transcriptional regulator